MMKIKRGEIYLVSLDVRPGEKQKIRPILVVQNDISNDYSNTIVCASITSRPFSKEFPTNVQISPSESGLEHNATVLLSHIRVMDKAKLIKKLGTLSNNTMNKIDLALKISLQLN
jgi:mRNA interferase MazF